MFGELLRRREVREVVWFHTDHWEPWGGSVDDTSLKRVESFTRQTTNSAFGRKMTLFYLSGTRYRLKSPLPAAGTGEEIVEAVPLTEHQDSRACQVVGELAARTDVEFQVHLHHETLVSNDSDRGSLHRSLKMLTDKEQDGRRLDFLLKTELARIRRHTGAALDNWAFVHGLWALNGSDRSVCQIDNEIEILMRNGCWGDFSFPAGRPHCDPVAITQPYTCVPYAAPKGYDLPDSAPVIIDVGAGAIGEGRFLIWNSRARHDVCSIDYYGDGDRTRLKNTDGIVLSWLSRCPVIDRTLYIKTHAHSMRPDYFEEGNATPLATPDVQAILDLLQSACDGAEVELKMATVGEVFARLREVDARCPGGADLAATDALGTSGVQELRLDGKEGLGDGAKPVFTDLVAVPILKDWIGTNPARLRSAGDYYMERLSRDRLFGDIDIAIADYCRRHFRHETKFFELGFGFGELSLLLALGGFQVTGYEGEAGRYAGAAMLAKALADRGAKLGTLSLVEGIFPDALDLRSLNTPSTALVVTNVTSSHIMDNIDFVYRGLRLFDHLIIDLSRFGVVRGPAAQGELIARLQLCGFVGIGQVVSCGDSSVRHFQRAEAADF